MMPLANSSELRASYLSVPLWRARQNRRSGTSATGATATRSAWGDRFDAAGRCRPAGQSRRNATARIGHCCGQREVPDSLPPLWLLPQAGTRKPRPHPKSRLLSSRWNFPTTDQHVFALLRRRAPGPSFKDLMDRSSGSGCGNVNDYRFTVGPRRPGQAAT